MIASKPSSPWPSGVARPTPSPTDAEVLTIVLLQGVLEVATLKQTSWLVARNWHRAFPYLPSYQPWITGMHCLLAHVGRLLATTWRPVPTAARLYLIDRTPILLCQPIRHGRVRLLRDAGA